MSTQRQACVLIFDGQCRLCVNTKSALERWPASRTSPVKFVSYQSQEALELLGDRYVAGRPAVAYLVEPGGYAVEGVEAFLRLLPRLPGGRVVVALLRFPPLHKLAAAAYKVVARHRYRWFGAMD